MRFEVLGGHFAHHSWPTQWPSWQLVRPPRATRAACDATLAAHRGYTSPEPRSRPRRDALAAEAAHRRGSCLMPCCPCPRMRIRGRADAWLRSKRLTCTVPRRPCRGTDEPLPRACRGARSASRPGGPAVALGHRDAEYGSRPLNGPPSKRRDLVQDGAAGVARACRGEVFYEASCRTKKSNCSRLGVIA